MRAGRMHADPSRTAPAPHCSGRPSNICKTAAASFTCYWQL